MNLPTPDPLALAHSEKLLASMIERIKNAGGKITFAQYMELVLYAPGLGYYAAGTHKLGAGGDFITAPELSSLFSYCLARYSQKILEELQGGDILEFGAGSGVMAKDILRYLQQHNRLPRHYFIMEISPDLKARQKELLQKEDTQIFERVVWLDQLPTKNFKGVILANEVLDAMPVHIFYRGEDEILEKYVTLKNNQLASCIGPASDPRLVTAVLTIEQELEQKFPVGYTSEINLFLEPWVNSLGAFMEQGEALIIDYGFLRPTYYHPQRSMGTVMCHYQHHAHMDPLILPGLQDITAHVDFSALGLAAEKVGFKVAHFSNQARFLLAAGLLEIMGDSAQQVKTLTSPSEMGELFKVMALRKNMG